MHTDSAQITFLLLQPGHCFHNILLKNKNEAPAGWYFQKSVS